MKVKRVLSLAAENLGREDLASALCDISGEPLGEVSSLLRCYQLIENEVALDYFPLKREEEVFISGGELPFSDLSRPPVEIYCARTPSGRKIPFSLRPARILFETLPKSKEKLILTYSYAPREKTLEDETEFGEKISARLLSFGVCCEFCITNGQFAEAAMWEKKFREALKASDAVRKPLFVRARRWA